MENKNIVDDKLEYIIQDLKQYVQVLYKENKELKELLYKASLNEPIDFDGDNFEKEDELHDNRDEDTIDIQSAIDRVGHNEIHNSNIGKKFMEDAIDEMYNEQDDPFTGF